MVARRIRLGRLVSARGELNQQPGLFSLVDGAVSSIQLSKLSAASVGILPASVSIPRRSFS